MQKREAWLNRVSAGQQQKASDSAGVNCNQTTKQQFSSSHTMTSQSSFKPAANHRASPVSANSTETGNRTISPESNSLCDDAKDSSHSSKRLHALNDVSSTETIDSEDDEPHPKISKQTSRLVAETTPTLKTVVDSSGDRKQAKPSSPTGLPQPLISGNAKNNGPSSSPSQLLADGKKHGPSSSTPTKTSPPQVPKPKPPPEKTSELNKVKVFLEKVFDCSVMVTDEVSRMRFSRGEMRIPPAVFPTSAEDLEPKMKVLVQQAFHKRIDKVKLAISAFNACESESSAYNDKMVDMTAAVTRTEAVRTVLSHFKEERLNDNSSDEGLWGPEEGGSEMYETYSFLPRLIESSRDNVNISPDLLSHLLSMEEADCMVSSLLRTGGSRFLGVKRLDEMLLTERPVLHALEVLVSNAQFGDALAKILTKEIDEAVQSSLGNYFQKKSALSQLLSVSTIPEVTPGRQNLQPNEAALAPFRSLRSFPRLTSDDVATAQTMIQKGIHELQSLVYKALKRVVTGKSSREVGLSWLAALISLNELRTSSVMQDNSGVQPVCSDGFMLNLCFAMLEFFLPISQSLDKLEKVDIGYSASSACRLNYDFEACLAGGQIAAEKGKERKLGPLPPELQGKHSFITECFHLTQRALSVTVIPAIKRYNKMHSFFNSQMSQAKGTDKEESVKNQHVLVSVIWETCLLDTDLVRNITTFYISQARLLLNAVKTIEEKYQNAEEMHQAQKEALSGVPEFCVKDMAQWFSFLAYTVLRVQPNAAKGITLTPFVDCCVMLLERTDLMPGPVPASMIVSALLSFMKDSDKDTRFSGRSGWGSGIMSDLAAMVHTCPSAQTKLGPALLRTYVNVDVVEGLDVDKDTFDKFNSRVQIGQLVQKLWSRSDCRASILDQCGTELFQKFLDSILDTLLYMFHDSLSRLANVKKVETLKANEAEWKKLSKKEQAEKDRFFRNEEHVGSGFMRQAKKTLKFLTLITQSDKVVRCFTCQPLATRAASTMNGFLDSLCGAKAKSFKVKDMAKYDFNPAELLHTIVSIILRITQEDTSRTDGYLVSMVKDPDFELTNMEKAQSVIVSKGMAGDDDNDKLNQLMEQLRQLSAEHNPQQPTSGDDDEGNWRDAFMDLDIDEGQLEKQYVDVMQDQRFNMVSHIQDMHCFHGNLQGGLDPRSPKIKALMKEIKQLTTSLPVSAGASIFVRQDKDRLDVMRALVTGPTGTPYSLGCFCFDIYFPASYPNVPPLVKIITTGNGTVRFNPNLYADGKVCLSLLGTWHAGDASEKWTPGQSSIYQVLVSIQSMILTPDPVFNEPGYESIKGTQEGETQSRQYNWKLHLQTLRHAVLGQLKKPATGFERVIRHHFALQREAVLKQCAQWVKGCEDPDILRRLRQAADAIFEEIMCLEVDFNEEEEDSEDEEEV
ncbi:uncharacterized protein [Littorina saxatilis]